MPPAASYATDEDIYIKRARDYSSLVPKAQIYAYGVDGVIPADDPWALHSSAVDFGALQITFGMILRLTAPTNIFGADGEYFAVDHVDETDPHTLHVRRPGGAPSEGDPAGYPGRSTLGVAFRCETLKPQLVQVSDELDAAFKIGASEGRTRADLVEYSRETLRLLCVMIVLRDQYLSEAESMNVIGGGKSVMYAKATELDNRIKSLWGSVEPQFVGAQPTMSPRRAGRIVRV
jgi:hypothetical protein